MPQISKGLSWFSQKIGHSNNVEDRGLTSLKEVLSAFYIDLQQTEHLIEKYDNYLSQFGLGWKRK